MPAYSMGKASKSPTFIDKNNTPGVGAYQTKTWNKQSRIKTSPSTSMSKTRKFFNPLQKSADNAGPGSYNPQKPHTSIMVSMKGKHPTQYKSQAPSPANYNSEMKYPTKQYSFGRSYRKFKTEEGPGPANYTLHGTQSTQGIQFGKQVRDKILSEAFPGPGTYASIPNAKSSVGFQQYTFPKEKKFLTEQTIEKSKGKIPGPGAYSISDFKKRYKGGKFTIGQRQSLADSNMGPGPTTYSPSHLAQKKNPQTIIGSQKRQTFTSNNVPGPGSYNMPKQETIKKKDGTAVFTQQQRLKNAWPKTPGPGSYQPRPVLDSRAASITTRHYREKKQKVPGPQDYNPDYTTVKTKTGCSAVFGSEQRLHKFKTEAPGPGQYKLDAKQYSKTFYFSKAKKAQKMNSTVGPGQYKLKPFIGVYDGSQKDSKQIFYV